MKLEGRLPFRMALLGLALMSGPVMAYSDNLSQLYCSNENTGSDYSPSSDIYMSMGKCFDICKANYAFAVVQYQSCWCSDYVPASQQSTGQCDQQCPGYPKDQGCGNGNQGLFGYIPLYKGPSGTAGAASSSHRPSSSPPESSYHPPPTSYVSKTVTQTVTKEEKPSPSVVTSYVTPTPSSSAIPIPSSSAPSSSEAPVSSSSPSAPPSPATTVQKTTVSGAIVTQTVTHTPTPVVITSSNSPDSMKMQRKGLSPGAIAGIVLGSLIGAAALALAAFLLWRRKKNTDAEGAASPTRRPKRNTSILSRTGLLAQGRPQSMSENNYEDPVYANTGTNSVRHSMMFGAGATVEGVSPVSPLGSSQENVSSRRHSRPMVYDQRLNPSALFANPEANSSRISMQDQQDYSRPLGIINTDWRSSFDSR